MGPYRFFAYSSNNDQHDEQMDLDGVIECLRITRTCSGEIGNRIVVLSRAKQLAEPMQLCSATVMKGKG